MSYLSKYIETLDLIEANVVKLKIKTNQVAVKSACTLFAVTLDHAQGIKFCLISKAYPSAFSLLRVLFETYIRGMWLEKCANTKQLDEYVNNDRLVSKDNKKISFGDMVLDVEKKHQLPKYFSEIKNNTWSGLNSLTHSGSVQLRRNFDGKSIKQCYEDEYIDEAIQFATMLSCMAFAGLCDLATSTDGMVESDHLMKFVQSWAFNESVD